MHSVLTALCLFASTAHAVPAQFTHQGRLLDADGAPIEDEATIIFRVTDSEMGGTALWEETITTPLTNGFYSAILGAIEDNPLDTDVLSQAPVWLELQLDGEPAMFPRSPINAVPYATMATVAEEVSGGPVDASQIAVDGTPVVNELGEWVGPAPTVNWTDIEGMPEAFADGIDDDTDTDTDSFAALGTSCLDGDIPVWDSVLVEWVCDMDQDTLAGIGCLDGQLIRWSGDAVGWMCADDADTLLTEDEVDAMVSDNGYAMASEIFSGSFLDLVDLPDGLADGDTTLSEDDVDAMVSDNGYALAADAFNGSFTALTDLPVGLEDGDDNSDTLRDLDCAIGEIAIQTEFGWACSTLAEQLDGDEDGAMIWADCDDADSSVGSSALDADCDGFTVALDCDDEDDASTHIGTDADCDGVLTDDDCDDFDATLTTLGDCDADGTTTELDCDDSNPESTTIATDEDCDGVETEDDCDDTEPDSSSWGTDGCPATSCKQLRSLYPSLGNGIFSIRPTGVSTTHSFYCDLNGTHATAGSLHLVSKYGAYSVQALSQCGGEPSGGDADCSPDADYATPYYEGVPSEQVSFDWRDEDDIAVSNAWLIAYSEGISEINVDGVRHYAYDADSSSQYKIQFEYVDGTSNSDDNRGSNWGPGATWLEWTTEGHNMMLGGQHSTTPSTPKIPRRININTMSSGNWGWHIRFTSTVDGKRGIWLH